MGQKLASERKEKKKGNTFLHHGNFGIDILQVGFPILHGINTDIDLRLRGREWSCSCLVDMKAHVFIKLASDQLGYGA